MTFIVRCDAPGCTSKTTLWAVVPAGWIQTHNRYGDVAHACPTAGHVAAAQATTNRVATATIV